MWRPACLLFAPIYRAAYRVLIHLAGLRLARFPGAKAVYLRRGCAKCETLPGVSDIDLAAVGDWDEEQCGRLRDRHRRLAWLLPVFDPRLRVYSPESLRRTYLSDPFLRHRIQEGTRTWKLLQGRDCLGDLPPLTRQQVLSGYHAELRGWWLHFVRRAYPPAGGQRDEILRNSICYKAVAETLRAELALRQGALLDSRKQILERAPDMLPMEAASASFLERLARSASERHLRYRGDIVEDTQRFLLPRLESCFRYLVHQMRASPFPAGVPRLDAPAAEQFQPAPGETVLTELADCARERLRVRRRGCYVTSGLSFAMDEVQFLIETGLHDLPSVAEIHGLGEVLRRSRVRPRRRVCVYLLLPCCAYQILAPDGYMPGQAVLTPASCPEVFQMLATPEALVSGAGPRSGEPAAWTQAAEDALCLDRGAAQQVIESAAARATGESTRIPAGFLAVSSTGGRPPPGCRRRSCAPADASRRQARTGERRSGGALPAGQPGAGLSRGVARGSCRSCAPGRPGALILTPRRRRLTGANRSTSPRPFASRSRPSSRRRVPRPMTELLCAPMRRIPRG